VGRKKLADELTAEELRLLLMEKRRSERRARLEYFRKTGKTVMAYAPISPAKVMAPRVTQSTSEDRVERPVAKKATWVDRVLLGVEIAAVLGLVFVILNGFSLMRSLNNEVANALAQPTLTPTALIKAVVLPSGHTPPNQPGGVRPNEAEIPEHLRPMVQSLANLPVPTASPEQAIRIQIPALKVDAPIVQGDGWEQLKKGVGQHVGSPNPGSKGNLVLSAHNDVFGEIFRELDRLKSGDKVTIYTSQHSYTYVVQQNQVVEPTQVEVMAPTREAVLTLISCYPYLVDNKRIIITALLQD
jgi:sortase A